MAQADSALLRAWELARSELSDQVEAELEELLPTLEAAGYVKLDEWSWAFTKKGITRIDELSSTDDHDPPDDQTRRRRGR